MKIVYFSNIAVRKILHNYSKTAFICLIVVLCLIVSSVSIYAGTNKALLIGISQYSEIDNLSFADRDVIEMKNILLNHAGYQGSNIKVLLNSDASKHRIARAFDTLVEDSKKRRLRHVIIMFSGHGKPSKYLGQETSIFLAPYDASLASNQFYRTKGGLIANDTFIDQAWLARQIASIRSEEVVLLIDSCYSGIIDFATLFAENLGFEFRRRPSYGPSRDIVVMRKKDVKRPGPSRVAFLASSAQDRLSWEYDELQHGALSYCLLKHLESIRLNTYEGEMRNISIGEIFSSVRSMFNRVRVKGQRLVDLHEPVLLPIPDKDTVWGMRFVSLMGTRRKEIPVKLVGKGSISISTKPAGALVEIDGKHTGRTTNCKLELPEGKYRITLRLTQTGYVYSFITEIKRDHHLRKEISLLGNLYVESFWEKGQRLEKAKGLKVFLDGAYVGKVALSLTNLPAGRHTLTVKYKDITAERSIEIRPDSPLTIRYILVRSVGGRPCCLPLFNGRRIMAPPI